MKLELTPKELKELKSIIYGFQRDHKLTELREEFWSLYDKINDIKYEN